MEIDFFLVIFEFASPSRLRVKKIHTKAQSRQAGFKGEWVSQHFFSLCDFASSREKTILPELFHAEFLAESETKNTQRIRALREEKGCAPRHQDAKNLRALRLPTSRFLREKQSCLNSTTQRSQRKLAKKIHAKAQSHQVGFKGEWVSQQRFFSLCGFASSREKTILPELFHAEILAESETKNT